LYSYIGESTPSENKAASMNSKDIDWLRRKSKAIKLQGALVAAQRERDYVQVRKLQENLVRSFGARALAVNKVSGNKGSKTSGLDGIIRKSDEQRMKAINQL
jgi:RNA-directed DNA polymerase